MYLGPLAPDNSFPRKPRYRVGDGLAFHEVTDSELIAFGESPADYWPPSAPRVVLEWPTSFWDRKCSKAIISLFVAFYFGCIYGAIYLFITK